ncbi:hypothetical protein BDV10DRAFT_162138 [Aspergillus recurvatus]
MPSGNNARTAKVRSIPATLLRFVRHRHLSTTWRADGSILDAGVRAGILGRLKVAGNPKSPDGIHLSPERSKVLTSARPAHTLSNSNLPKGPAPLAHWSRC